MRIRKHSVELTAIFVVSISFLLTYFMFFVMILSTSDPEPKDVVTHTHLTTHTHINCVVDCPTHENHE